MSTQRLPTTREIATACGCNQSTVSHALNNNLKIAEDEHPFAGRLSACRLPNDPCRLKVVEVNTHLAKLDDANTAFLLGLGQNFLNTNGMLSKGVMHDLLHLTIRGYRIRSDKMAPKLAELMQ